MKRKISVLAAVLLAIGLTACGNDETQATHDAAQTVWAESSEEVKTTAARMGVCIQSSANLSCTGAVSYSRWGKYCRRRNVS